MLTVEETSQLLRTFDNILILTHLQPDGDTAGSAAALCVALRAMGKTAYVLDNPQLMSNARPFFQPCVAPETFQPDTVIAVDCAEKKRLQINAGPYQERVDLAIDHHPSFLPFGRENLLRSTSAACGEILYDVLKPLTPLTQEIALPLYVALATDCGCFAYANTTAESHRIAAELMDTGIDAYAVNKTFFRTKTRTRMQLEGAMVQSAVYYDSDRVAVLTASLATKESLHVTHDDTENVASLGAQMEGVDCAVTLHETAPGVWRCSLRSAGTHPRVNATDVCRLLGGGGHAAAAGATLQGTREEVLEQVLCAIARCVPDFRRQP